jgi:hypothetical protein
MKNLSFRIGPLKRLLICLLLHQPCLLFAQEWKKSDLDLRTLMGEELFQDINQKILNNIEKGVLLLYKDIQFSEYMKREELSDMDIAAFEINKVLEFWIFNKEKLACQLTIKGLGISNEILQTWINIADIELLLKAPEYKALTDAIYESILKR